MQGSRDRKERSPITEGAQPREMRRLWFWRVQFHKLYLPPARQNCSGDTILIPYPQRVVKEKMSHLNREQIELVNRTKKVIGQMESVLRALEEDAHCADVLQRLAAARGAINSLMGELLENHILNHMPRKNKASADAAQDIVEVVRTYLK